MAGKIQDQDVKGSSELTSDTRLINVNKIYSTALGKRLDQALSNGDLGNLESASLASNYTITATVAANALTIALKTKAGTDPSSTDPVKVAFRNSSNGTGDFTTLTITSALSLVVSSGSTLGHISTLTHNIWVYLFNDAGTPRLGVCTTLFSPDFVRSSTAEGGAGAADSNNVVYTGTAVTNKPFRIIGKLESTQTTAGTWATAPSLIALDPVLTDRVFAQYETTAGQSMTGGAFTRVNFGTRQRDSHNAVVTGVGTWAFTCPRPGNYTVGCAIRSNSVDAGGQYFLRLNGTLNRSLSIRRNNGGGADDLMSEGSYSGFFAQGDTIYFEYFNPSTQPLTAVASQNYCYVISDGDV